MGTAPTGLPAPPGPVVFTVGHSTHPIETLIALLRRHRIQAVADVRSSPYSSYSPQFNQGALRRSLSEAGIVYVHLGVELGARPDAPEIYVGGKASYQRMAARPEFQAGLERVIHGARRFRLALLCAEKDPARCHRMILVCRNLRPLVSGIEHILADGSLETNFAAEKRLCRMLGLEPTLFEDEATIVEYAYDLQEARIAFVPEEKKTTED